MVRPGPSALCPLLPLTVLRLIHIADKKKAFWWEPLEMCRKLILTGAVLLIGEEFEQARVLVALLVSIAFVTLHLSIKPLRRCEEHKSTRALAAFALVCETQLSTRTPFCRAEDGALMLFVELALILIYTSVLLFKSCETSPSVCKSYGFGESAEGERSPQCSLHTLSLDLIGDEVLVSFSASSVHLLHHLWADNAWTPAFHPSAEPLDDGLRARDHSCCARTCRLALVDPS